MRFSGCLCSVASSAVTGGAAIASYALCEPRFRIADTGCRVERASQA
jgi:hypothetical protein